MSAQKRSPVDEEKKEFPADLCCMEGGVSRVDRMPPEEQAKVVEMLEGRAADPAHRELRSRFYDLAGIVPGRRVLDVGCGTGADARAIAVLVAPGGSVLGIDPSEVLLLEARRRTHREIPARFERASGENMPVSSGSMDRAVAIGTLSHIREPQPVIAEMVRVVRPGGRVALFDRDMGTFVIDASDRKVTRAVFSCHSEGVSGMDAGRRLHALLKGARLRCVQTFALPLVDTGFSSYFRFVVDRYPDRAVQDGIITAEQAEAWRRDIRSRAERGVFFGSVTYFASVGVKQ